MFNQSKFENPNQNRNPKSKIEFEIHKLRHASSHKQSKPKIKIEFTNFHMNVQTIPKSESFFTNFVDN